MAEIIISPMTTNDNVRGTGSADIITADPFFVTNRPVFRALSPDLLPDLMPRFPGDNPFAIAFARFPIEFSAGALRGGDDRVFGLGGDDLIEAGFGNDTIFGDGGNDFLHGRLGNDILFGGQGADILFGESFTFTFMPDIGEGFGFGPPVVLEGPGDDRLFGGGGEDQLFGFGGNDDLFGDGDGDRLAGGDGDDLLDGGEGNDLAPGGLFGGAGNDRLFGRAGDDDLFGGADDDFLDGGDGSDLLRGESGDDHLFGGPGDDSTAQVVVVDGQLLPAGLFGGFGNDDLHGDQGNDTLDGGPNDDELEGGIGNDTLNGGPDNDRLQGGSDPDTFIFEQSQGNDTILDFEKGSDRIGLRSFFANPRDSASPLLQFGDLDTNGNQVLDDNDLNVAVEPTGETEINLTPFARDGGSSVLTVLGLASNQQLDVFDISA